LETDGNGDQRTDQGSRSWTVDVKAHYSLRSFFTLITRNGTVDNKWNGKEIEQQ